MIKKKIDMYQFISSFQKYARWDGMKYIFVINHPQITINLMQYPDKQFTIHRICDYFCDIIESPVEGEELYNLIWRYRKFINKALRVTVS